MAAAPYMPRVMAAALVASWALASTASAQEPASQPLEARSLLAADHEATLTSDGAMLLKRLPFDIGDRFAAGDVLIEFDCTLRQARVQSISGVSKGTAARLESKQRLLKSGTIGALEVELARADAQKAEGELAEAKDAAARCAIRAPFAGRVAKRHANVHEVVGPDRPLLSIVSDGPLRITTIVPSVWLRWLTVGASFDVAVDETGGGYRAKVVAIAGRVDPASQSVELLGRIEGGPEELLPGMSGVARFSRSIANR